MKLDISMKQIAQDRQPKNSVRYISEHGDSGIESIYIRRTSLPEPAPEKIHICVRSVGE